MSKWYFSSKERQEALRKELREWRGTPYRHRAAVKKAGADCFFFVAKVYESLGAVKGWAERIMKHYYSSDWCFHTTEERLYNGLKKVKELEEIKNFNTIMNGDLILFHFGKVASHCAIYFEGQIYQVVELAGVHKLYYKDSVWYPRRKFLFRVKNV